MKSSEPERRRVILKAAEKLFRHYGPSKTTIGDIAREAEIGVGSVYLEFCSKDEIVGELASRRHHRVLEVMRAAAVGGTVAEQIAAALEARVVELFELADEGAHACDLVLCSSSPVKRAYVRLRADELAFVTTLLEEGERSGEIALEGGASETAELIQRAFATFSPPWLFEQERRVALRSVRAMTTLLLRGLLTRSSVRPAVRRKRP